MVVYLHLHSFLTLSDFHGLASVSLNVIVPTPSPLVSITLNRGWNGFHIIGCIEKIMPFLDVAVSLVQSLLGNAALGSPTYSLPDLICNKPLFGGISKKNPPALLTEISA